MRKTWTIPALLLAASLFFPSAPALAWEGGEEEETVVERYRMLAQGAPSGERKFIRKEKMEGMDPAERREHMDEMRDTVHLWRLHKMREALELTDDQFMKVMKIEESRTAREREIGDRFEGTLPKLREALEANAPDKDVQTLLDALLKARDERRRAEDAYEADMRGALSPRQQAKFLVFQRQFERKVREVIVEKRMERREGEAPEPPMPPRPPKR